MSAVPDLDQCRGGLLERELLTDPNRKRTLGEEADEADEAAEPLAVRGDQYRLHRDVPYSSCSHGSLPSFTTIGHNGRSVSRLTDARSQPPHPASHHGRGGVPGEGQERRT